MTLLAPGVRALLDTVLLPAKPPFDAQRLRLGHLLSQDLLAGDAAPVHQVGGFTVDPDPRWGTPRLAVRRYEPRVGCRRAIVWLHGGGWVVGTLDSYDAVARGLAVATDSQVFVVDYRLAPEAPYPAALADCSAVVEAIVRNAVNLGLDPARVVVAGDSAGGHLSVGTTRWLAAAASPARPAALALIYPVTDARMRHHSYARFAEGYFLSAAQMAWFWQQFAPQGTGAQGVPLTLEHPDLSPLLAHDLHCLPSTLVVTAECDILHDEGQAFASVLGRAGVPHEYVEVPGLIHGFLRFRSALRQAQDLPDRISAQLDRWKI